MRYYTFDVKMFDNEPDETFERFSKTALERLAELSRSTVGVFGGEPVARVLEARVVIEQHRLTKAGDPYRWVKARINVPLNEKTSALVYEIEHGHRHEISVGCSVQKVVCSICGKQDCAHVPGHYYYGWNWTLCCKELCGVDEIYEWRFSEKMGTEKKPDIKKRPKICDVLGVEVGEKFTYPGMAGEFWVTENGHLKNFWDGEFDLITCVPTLINNADKIVKSPKWTDQEVEDANTVLRMFGKDNFTHIQKDEDGWPSLMDGDGKDPNVGWCSIGMEKDMFPSLKPGQTVKLSDIVGGN